MGPTANGDIFYLSVPFTGAEAFDSHIGSTQAGSGTQPITEAVCNDGNDCKQRVTLRHGAEFGSCGTPAHPFLPHSSVPICSEMLRTTPDQKTSHTED